MDSTLPTEVSVVIVVVAIQIIYKSLARKNITNQCSVTDRDATLISALYFKGDNLMKADKVTVKITTESLSIDCLWSLLTQAYEQIKQGMENGSLTADDGDIVSWSTRRDPVEF